ncbi:non-ribosomal peptide synthetase [Caldimonas brevitalea]|uniref:Peptide synthetase n=1 Tax=Caldimonas brevitalea TaxID=413882 RepID=A0A0G3BPY5_9BURK|nr:non-ribosomal peptide synthetase [Caldimonas brevitalea]AKJ29411.1 peptide synthetase [Caldimonas brevitalea]
MNVESLLALLEEKRIRIHADDGELVVQAPRGALDAGLAASLKSRKGELLQTLQRRPAVTTPRRIITPEMLTLVQLSQEAIDTLVARVDGGAANVQDIYPLAPLQEGILFHHLMEQQGDGYLLFNLLGFDHRERLDRFLAALQQVIDRHDILRTGIVWEGLEQPVQVVHRQATLPVAFVECDPGQGDVAQQLEARFDPRQLRLDLGQPPLLRCHAAHDPRHGRWVLHVLSHHLVSDHTTLELLLEEAQAIVQGRGDTLPAPAPFRNFVAQARLGIGPEEHQTFFKALLADIDEPTVPFGLLRVPEGDRRMAEVRQPLAPEVARSVRAQARRLGVSAASLMHLAWALVLARTTGRRDVVFGTVLFGRLQGGAAADRVLGLFINTLPLRIGVDDEPVESALKRTHALLAQLLRHEHAPLALAQRCSGVPAQTPLFTSLLNYRYSAQAPQTHEGRGVALGEGIELLGGHERTDYPVSVDIDDVGDDFIVTAQVTASLDAQQVCDLMVTAVSGLVLALERAPARAVADVEVLPAAERARVLGAWPDQPVTPPVHAVGLHRLFESQAAQRPDALALVQGGHTLRYGELNAEANRLAHHLRQLGVGADDRVALYATRSVDTIVALLAILKAGAAYVPLDAGYPAERLVHMLRDSAPVALLTQGGAPAWVHEALGEGVPVLDLQADAAAWQQHDERDLGPSHTDEGHHHLAYVIYTSGSTGRPKGVMVEHRSVVNQVTALARRIALQPTERVLQFASLSFDASVEEVFATLTHGATLVLRSDEWLSDAGRFWALCEAHGIAVVDLPTQFWAQLALEQQPVPSTVRQVIIGGEAVSERALQAWFSTPGHRPRLLNTYGPTEATVSATWHEATGETQDARTIGRPSEGTRVYILDAHRRPVPIGVPGELYIGGVQVARGYLNLPEQTAERFLANPWWPGERLYKTGDLGRWWPDGRVEYLGRNDFQVKLRGFRVEPGEIEAHLAQVEGVQQVVVLAREDQPGDPRLVAYYSGDGAPAPEALKQHAAQGLPAYMVPAACVRLQHWPLTPNGKLDRKALPAPEGGAEPGRPHEAPRGEFEVLLAGLWAELLKLDRVGRHDHFFERGGHSLLAVQLVSRVRKALGVELPLAVLFEQPVLSRLAAHLSGAAVSQADTIEPADRGGPLPLSPAQQRLWFLSRMEGASAAYHVTGAVRLIGKLQVPTLQRALQAVVDRHEALRTRFRLVEGEPVQEVLTGVRLAIETHDLREAVDAEAALQSCSLHHASAAFDLTRDLPMRVLLLQLGEQEHVLQVVMHHIVCDGWSVGVLLDEVSRLYGAFEADEPDPLPPLALQYADYAAWQRRGLAEGRLQSEAAYWREALAGAPALLELPTDRPRPAQQDHRGDVVPVQLDPALSQALKTLSQRHGVTLYMTLLASWAALLSRLSGQAEVVIGSPVAGRQRAELEPLIGFFVNTLALRLDLGAVTVAELLQHTKARVLVAQQHQDLPFDQVVEVVQPPRSLSHTPLFQVMFDWQNTPTGELHMPGLDVQALDTAQTTAQFDLTLSLHEGQTGIAGVLNYATALFERETVERYIDYWRELLQALVADVQRPVRRLALLPEAEREQLLHSWNEIREEYPRYCLHQRFEAQAQATPNVIALVHGDEQLSYGELNDRANRLAHHLRREHGIGPDSRVALCVERSVEMVVALLATLKAGGAYVPLDPAYASERLLATLQDSQPRLVLLDAIGRQALGQLEGQPVLDLQSDAGRWADASTENLDVGVQPQHLAYVIYTSGSTGQPKGVMVEHAQVARLFGATAAWFGFGPEDRWSLFHSIGFDFSVWEIWGALLHGGRLVIVPLETARSPAAFHQLLCQQGITVLNQTPSAFQQLVSAQGEAPQPHQLRHIVFGGEALELRTLKPWYEREVNRGTQLRNMYGITETTVHVTWRALQPGDAERPGPSPIGGRLPDLRLYVLDAERQPVPVGVTGELYVGGAGVARGYLNRAELTAQRFVDNPFVPGERLYKTGDLGRWLSDGTLEYLGRNDFQVKIRGFRIELGEIEAQLAVLPGVREVVVLAREDQPGDKRLVAYYTGEDAPPAEVLRQQATQQLPPYMVPAAYVRLAQLPLTPNGKLDRQALPAPDSQAYVSRAYAAPEGEVEQTLARLWAELLQLERVGRHDNFFELGGHSLLAVTLIERLRALGLQTDVRALFTSPTLAELAAQLGREPAEHAVPPNLIPPGATRLTPQMLTLVTLDQAALDTIVDRVEGGAANVQDIYPLAPLQEGILFHHLMHREGDPYLLHSLLAFDSRSRLDRFLAVLQQVIDRHDILRTGIAWQGLDQPVQVVLRHAPLPVEFVDLDPAQGDIVQQLQTRYDPSRQRLDVSCAPLLHCHAAADPEHGRWVLSVLSHHLIDDNTTLKLLLAEAQAIEQGRFDQLPPPVPFRHHVAQAALGVSRQEHEAYFRRCLGDIDEPTAPFGLLDVQGDGGAIVEAQHRLSPALARALRERARHLGVSAASLMHLAWGLVLARTTGRQDVVFGTVLIGRLQGGAQAERGMGLFINTLPLRLRVAAEAVEPALRHTHTLLAQLLRHEHASLALAQRCSGVAPPLPLFSSLLNYRHSEELDPGRQAEAAAGFGEGIELLSGQERTNYPVTLSVDDLGQEFLLTAQAAAPLAPERVCAYMATALEQLELTLRQSPQAPLRSLDVLPAAEAQQLQHASQGRARTFAQERCVHELFEAQARHTPDACALQQGRQQIGYRELNARANQLARHLRRLGVQPDSRVAVCLDRSPEMVVALLAVLKAGGAYVPLDPGYPPDRLDYLLQDSAPVAVLTHARIDPAVQARLCVTMARHGSGAPVIDLLGDAAAWQHEDGSDLPPAGLTSRHLAYVIYTSGSTGQPKGVMVEHRSLHNLLAWHIDSFSLQPGSRSSATAGVGFDACTWEVWPPLCSGGVLVLPPADVAGDPQALLAWWQAERLDVSFLVTPLAELAYATGRVNAGVRQVLIGGDRLRRRPPQLPPGQALVNNYGPTEATVVATSGTLHEHDGALHIGRPIDNTRVYILDAEGRPTPQGVPGELYVAGVGVARGYLGRPELSAERFLQDPFVAGDRMYKTGDLGRWRADGSIEYLGRNDFQVKIRGFRIEPGEIEAQLAQLDGVQEVAVLAREDQPGEPRLVAYYTGEAALDPERLREHAAHRLPTYMVPSAYVHLPSWPLTPNGKLDRKALPAPEVSAERGYEAPQGEIEQTLAAIWSELLGVPQVGRHDDFFALGGHSLLAVQLVSRLRRALQVELPLADLFARPALAQMAAGLAQASQSALPPIPAVDRGAPLALSLAQQRLWFLTQVDGASQAYHISGAVRLSGPLDVPVLCRALQAIVDRHETLRTRFVLDGGEPVQQVLREAELPLTQDDLCDQAGAEQLARQRAEAHAAQAFDLSTELPVRVLLLRVAEGEHLLQVVMHHIAADGWSVGIFLDELSRLYRAGAEADPLPPLPLQYADYAAWQRAWLAGGRLERQVAFWRETLGDAPTLLELPTDRPRPPRQDHAGASVEWQLDAGLSQVLKDLSRRHGVTLYMTLLASWGALLARLSGQDDLVIGSPVAGRNRAEVEPLIGCFVNTLALRLDLRGAPSVAELLERTRTRVLAAQQHQDLPFDQVVEVLRPPRSLAHTPVFQVMFDWHNTPEGRLTMPGLIVSDVDSELPTAQFDLMLSLQDGEAGIAGALNYATALFDAETATRWLACWQQLLGEMVADDRRPLPQLPLLPSDQRRQVLELWNDTERELPLHLCAHELFEGQVLRHPDAVAVDDGEQRLSYLKLNRRANQLARHLRGLGVRPGDRIALCAERGTAMVVGLLAILKAGAAYVPLDPAYPAERIAYMLQDSAPAAVLCTATTRESLAAHLPAELPVLDLRADVPRWSHQPGYNPTRQEVGVGPDHLAYVIYTSGSTGRPKGVMVEHRGLVNYTLEAVRWFELGPADTVLQQNSLNFDLSIEEMLPALASGAALTPSRQTFGLDTADNSEGRGRRPSMIHLTAAHWHSLVGEWSQPGGAARARVLLDGVRLVNVTGDALSQHRLKQWDAVKPAATRLINTYGPTEITVSCSAAYVQHEPGAARVSIGRPFANTRMYLLDPHGQPVPVGVAGELYIGGAGVARGYLNLPELTAERFLQDPFKPGQRVYKTGDLARWRPDGQIEFIGRNDFQVKVRGFRIELGEVEARLARHPGVQEVAVLAREDAPGEKRLVAYHTGTPAVPPDDLRQHALQHLPPYMVPAAFVHLAALPLTPGGKLDRAALPAPDGHVGTGRDYEAPQGDIEQKLARLWAELLKLERVGRHDNFFELGGHSLLAVSLVERMRREDLQADVSQLFTASTLAELAAGTTQLKEILL